MSAAGNAHYQRNKNKINAERRARRTSDPEYAEHIRKQKREWQSANKDKKKGQTLRYSYGITLDDYNDIFDVQGGRCAICGAHQSELKKALAVDHNHETGKVRGLLCDHCNLMLGKARDKAHVLMSAAHYLQSGGVE